MYEFTCGGPVWGEGTGERAHDMSSKRPTRGRPNGNPEFPRLDPYGLIHNFILRQLWTLLCERFRTGNVKLGLSLVIRLSAFAFSITITYLSTATPASFTLKRCVCGRLTSSVPEDLLCSPPNNIATSRSSFPNRTSQSKFSISTILDPFPYWSLSASLTRERPSLKSTHNSRGALF